MKLLFKQRFFSWFDSYDIYNEAGDTVYTVEGKLAWGHKLEIHDKDGNHIATLTERIFTFLPKFEMYVGGEYIGEIVKKFTLFKPAFEIGCYGYTVKGDFFEWDYQIMDGERTVATIEKELLHFTDTYAIDVSDERDALASLMIVLAIDAVKCSQK